MIASNTLKTLFLLASILWGLPLLGRTFRGSSYKVYELVMLAVNLTAFIALQGHFFAEGLIALNVLKTLCLFVSILWGLPLLGRTFRGSSYKVYELLVFAAALTTFIAIHYRFFA